MQSFRAVPWSTALVTGASSGIGEAIAEQLASRGVGRLILVARRADQLQAVAARLTSRYSTEVEVLAADLCDAASRALVEARLAAEAPAPVDLLVNNAGFGTSGDFVGLPVDEEDRQIQLNVTALTRLTRAVLPGLVERGRGAVMNISSMASYQPSPGTATYSATKAFVTLFGESLYEELRGTGVTVTTVLPGFTRTEFQSKLSDSSYQSLPDVVWTEAADVARLAVTATAKGRALCIPGVLYQAAAALVTPLPRSARRMMMGKLSGLPDRLAGKAVVADAEVPPGASAAAAEMPIDPGGAAETEAESKAAAKAAAKAEAKAAAKAEAKAAARAAVDAAGAGATVVADAPAPVDPQDDAQLRAEALAESLSAKAKRAGDFAGEPFDPKKTIEIERDA